MYVWDGAAVSCWSVGAAFILTYDTVEIMTALSVDAEISSKTKRTSLLSAGANFGNEVEQTAGSEANLVGAPGAEIRPLGGW
jgi:hypothetical protein